MTIEVKNVEIAKMLSAAKENWYPPNKDTNTTGDYYTFPSKTWYPAGVRQHGDYALKFHSDANWQFEALEWAEKQGYEISIIDNECAIINKEIAENEENPFDIKPLVFIVGKTKKEAIFEALYQFSVYLKEKK